MDKRQNELIEMLLQQAGYKRDGKLYVNNLIKSAFGCDELFPPHRSQPAPQGEGLYRWVKAIERLGKFEDSEIPHWKFWHPGFCKVDGEPAERPFFRKDIEIGKVVFSYIYISGSGFDQEIPESDFHRIEWLEPVPSQPTGDVSILTEALVKIKQMCADKLRINSLAFFIPKEIDKALSSYQSSIKGE